jgi:periplasmic protein CpxP/Spy
LKRNIFRNPCIIGSAILAWPLLAIAAPPAVSDPHSAGSCQTQFRGPPGPPGAPMGPGGGPLDGDREGARPPRFLMGLILSDDQQDKVFAIVHAAAPALRNQSKAARKAREALHEFSRSAQFNDGAATTLAQAQGKAESQLALLRTRMEHEVYAVLTSEQQGQVADRQHERDLHHGERPLRY